MGVQPYKSLLLLLCLNPLRPNWIVLMIYLFVLDSFIRANDKIVINTRDVYILMISFAKQTFSISGISN